jgi:hypothetical protein
MPIQFLNLAKNKYFGRWTWGKLFRIEHQLGWSHLPIMDKFEQHDAHWCFQRGWEIQGFQDHHHREIDLDQNKLKN